MKLVILLATAGGLACAAPVAAQSLDPLSYVEECPAPTDPSDDWCGYNREKFTTELPLAYRADYQAVRNVSYCLATGCDGSVRIDLREACAWRVIAYGLAPTGDDKLLEQQSMRAYCSNVPEVEVRAFLDAILMRVDELPN